MAVATGCVDRGPLCFLLASGEVPRAVAVSALHTGISRDRGLSSSKHVFSNTRGVAAQVIVSCARVCGKHGGAYQPLIGILAGSDW